MMNENAPKEAPAWAWKIAVSFNKLAKGREAEIKKLLSRWLASERKRSASLLTALPKPLSEADVEAAWKPVQDEYEKCKAQGWRTPTGEKFVKSLVPEKISEACANSSTAREQWKNNNRLTEGEREAESIACLAAFCNAVIKALPDAAEHEGFEQRAPQLERLTDEVTWGVLFPPPVNWEKERKKIECDIGRVEELFSKGGENHAPRTGWKRGKLILKAVPNGRTPGAFAFGRKEYTVPSGKAWACVCSLIKADAFDGHGVAMRSPGEMFKRHHRQFFTERMTSNASGWYIKTV